MFGNSFCPLVLHLFSPMSVCLSKKKPKSSSSTSPSVILNTFIGMPDLRKKTCDLIYSSLHQGVPPSLFFFFKSTLPPKLRFQPCQPAHRRLANNYCQRKWQNFLDTFAEKAPTQRGHGSPVSFQNLAVPSQMPLLCNIQLWEK